ncbi:STAS domain-containing protein [Botryobacter ruber]|uniref:STAS domain-containing protein n=1 Tax=Botryobacter ruber TaxID=2171629 RepID=UPI000E0C4E13|nr:STAS domain-containing protein [Botryobacter ruber]
MKQFDVTTSWTKGMMEVALSGELDASSSAKADQALERAIDMDIKSLLINCQQLTYISSAGLGVFLAHFQAYSNRGIRMVFYGMQPKIRNIFEIVGLQSIFSIASTFEDAVMIASS